MDSQNPFIDLYSGLGKTNLFRIVRTFILGLDCYQFHLKGTGIILSFQIREDEKPQLTILNESSTLTPSEFWEIIPSEYKKTLVYHLGDILS